jgi:hypothetical protein
MQFPIIYLIGKFHFARTDRFPGQNGSGAGADKRCFVQVVFTGENSGQRQSLDRLICDF